MTHGRIFCRFVFETRIYIYNTAIFFNAVKFLRRICIVICAQAIVRTRNHKLLHDAAVVSRSVLEIVFGVVKRISGAVSSTTSTLRLKAMLVVYT